MIYDTCIPNTTIREKIPWSCRYQYQNSVKVPEGVHKELKTEAYFYFEIRKRIVLNKDINDPRWFLVNMHCALPLL